MTTSQRIAPPDRTETDDVAGRETAARLSLSPAGGHGSSDGGRWPRSRRLADERLLTALAGAGDADVRTDVSGSTSPS